LIKAGSKFKYGDRADDDEETATNKQVEPVMNSQYQVLSHFSKSKVSLI